MVIFGAEWCPDCRNLHDNLHSPEVAAYMEDHMDYVTVDVGHIPGVTVGDRTTLIGRQGDQEIGLEEVARRADTIPYEIACAVGKRVERTYHGGEAVLFPPPKPEP